MINDQPSILLLTQESIPTNRAIINELWCRIIPSTGLKVFWVAEFKANLGDLSSAYDLFVNEDEVDVDYLIMGPGCGAKDESQAKANKLIAIAEQRKDCGLLFHHIDQML